MKRLGNVFIPDNGKEAFELALKKAVHSYEVVKGIGGYYRLRQDGVLILDDPACVDTSDEDSAYYFFAEWIKEYDK